MNYILFDRNRQQLLPFTHTRAVADIRCGIVTMRERWEKLLNTNTFTLTEHHLQALYPTPATDEPCLYINASFFATHHLLSAVKSLKDGEKLVHNNEIIAAATYPYTVLHEFEANLDLLKPIDYKDDNHYCLRHVWDIFSLNERAIKDDFITLSTGHKSEAIPAHVVVIGKENLFIEAGAAIGAGTIINATTGPVYIGKDAEILEGTLIRGPLAVCEHAAIKMGAKIYGATTIGPGCKVGGEINNTVFFANSNKGHDGYLGNAVIGEWCNLGADTNASNLKNNYDEVKIWDEHSNRSVKTGLTFVGLIMGDHSKCGINTMFNTGTVVGVSCNIYGGDFPAKFVPSFSWGGSNDMTTYDFTRAMETANRMMGRRNKNLSENETKMYRHIFDYTAKQRNLFLGEDKN